MVIVWTLRGNSIRTALCWVVWHIVHSQQHTHMSSSYRFSRLGLSHWDPYAVRRGGCLELYMVTWWSGAGGIQALSERPTGFLLCFDTVGLVIWPVKIVPEMTCNVLSGTLSLYTTTTQHHKRLNGQWSNNPCIAGWCQIHACSICLRTRWYSVLNRQSESFHWKMHLVSLWPRTLTFWPQNLISSYLLPTAPKL